MLDSMSLCSWLTCGTWEVLGRGEAAAVHWEAAHLQLLRVDQLLQRLHLAAQRVAALLALLQLLLEELHLLLLHLHVHRLRGGVGTQQAILLESERGHHIHVGAAAPEVPPALLSQLASPGRMIIPVGGEYESQSLMVIDRNEDGETTYKDEMGVVYVPLTSEKHQLER